MPETVRVRSWFVYPVPTVELPAGSSDSATVRIESASDFYWIKATMFAEDNSGIGGGLYDNRVIPSVDVQIQSSGADRNMFNGYVPVPSVFGFGELPYVLPFPAELLANSEVRFDFRSREPARQINLYLALHGWKDYGELRTDGNGG